ncbi:MAG: hypothetical protein FD180_1955 [Planctomycetota bacterium]|nr:MAG: hypothetical protein FD180_1955 [Planctomycetota bacterium]
MPTQTPLATAFAAEPYLKICERSPVAIRAPRAAKRRMALVLLVALGVFIVPMAFMDLVGGALIVAAIPIALLFTTFTGGNTVRIDDARRRLRVLRHYGPWTRTLLDWHFSDVAGVTVERRLQEGHEPSPLTPVSALAAPLGIHVHFEGSVVYDDVWDLCLESKSNEKAVVISSRDSASAEMALELLNERLRSSGLVRRGVEEAARHAP